VIPAPSGTAAPSRRRKGRCKFALHLGHDVRRRGSALHRYRRSRSGVSHGPRKTRCPAEQFFKSDEQHIRTLAWDATGNLIAGSDGSGLVYRISPQGKGYVLFEAPRREITSVAVASDGTIYAPAWATRHAIRCRRCRFRESDGDLHRGSASSLQAANTSASVPEGSEIYALSAARRRKIWAGKDEVVYALTARTDGLLALSGNRGRIFRIAANGNYADIAHLEDSKG